MSDIQIKDLLKDAIILADKDKGLAHFCVEPEDRRNFWVNLSKYSSTKAINQALDAIMMGRSFDEVMERFLRNLSVKIPDTEKKELEEFVEKVKEILKKYYGLRKSNVSEFIKAKNSLISAIFVFTRYQNLKEVCHE